MPKSTSEESFPPFLPSFKAEIRTYLRDTLSRVRQEAIIKRYQAALQKAKQNASHETPPKTAEEIEKIAQKILLEAGMKIEKVTQEEMAAALHITPRAYGDLERGRSNFSATTLIILLAKLPSNEQTAILHAFTEILSKCEEQSASR